MLYKKDLVRELRKLGYTKKAISPAIDDIFYIIARMIVEGEPLQLRGFGTFSSMACKGHKGVDPNTGESIMIAGYKKAKFKASPVLLDAVRTGDVSRLQPDWGDDEDEDDSIQ